MYVSHNFYECITTRIIVVIIKFKCRIYSSKIVPIHEFFCSFIDSTKLTYSSSKFVLMLILYNLNLIILLVGLLL